MAIQILYDADLTVNAQDLSDYVRSITINFGAAIQDATAMQGAGVAADEQFTAKRAGLKDWSIDVEFNQDYAASAVDATLFDLVGADPFEVIAHATDAVVGATNPYFTGDCVLESYQPIAGAVGDLATTTVTFQGTGELDRTTS